MTTYGKLTLSTFLALILVSCGAQDKSKQSKNATSRTYTVKPQLLQKTLHFTGIIQPIHESTLISPMEAVVDTMTFHYGQVVKKGDLVFTLNSTELQKQYNDTLTDYLKAKDNFTIAKAKFLGTEDLWDAGLLSKNNYLSEKSSMDTVRITLMQARRKLSEMLEKIEDKNTQNLSKLSLSDFDKLKKILATDHNVIKLKAPGNGVVLYPPKTSEDKNTRINVGSFVKSGQVLALIGDLSGISVEIDVPEIDIDKIHTGMKATISGVAFGKHPLEGTVVAVNAQASNSGNGGLPSFTAVVEVSSLTEAQQSWIKVGMSASIEVHADSENQLIIPMAAIKRAGANSIVTVQLAKGLLEKRTIETGTAQADSVVVESGLKTGDVVVYD